MDHTVATAFAQTWVTDWNNHDLDALLTHFTDEVVFTSPFAVAVFPDRGGVVRGKDELREYWAAGLARIPDLHFTIEAVYAGVATIVINYRNHTGALVCEVLTFEGQRVREGHGTYLSNDAASASGAHPAR